MLLVHWDRGDSLNLDHLRSRQEWKVSVRREVIGKGQQKCTYLLFVVAVKVAYIRWLAREGCRKLV